MAFLVSGEIEFLCLFAIQDEVTGEKRSNLRGNYQRQRTVADLPQNMTGFQNGPKNFRARMIDYH